FIEFSTPDIFDLSLHDALPIYKSGSLLFWISSRRLHSPAPKACRARSSYVKNNTRITATCCSTSPNQKPLRPPVPKGIRSCQNTDRKSTRLNSSHVKISYADFC